MPCVGGGSGFRKHKHECMFYYQIAAKRSGIDVVVAPDDVCKAAPMSSLVARRTEYCTFDAASCRRNEIHIYSYVVAAFGDSLLRGSHSHLPPQGFACSRVGRR